MNNNLTKSLETYLLAIDNLLAKQKNVIVKDVAEFLHFQGATTAQAIKKLKEKGYINYEPYQNITLTSLGEKTVLIRKYRHETISDFLNQVLNIDMEDAKLNADRMEYSISDDVLNRLVNFMDFMKQCLCTKQRWIKSCQTSLKNGEMSNSCKNCSGKCSCSGTKQD